MLLEGIAVFVVRLDPKVFAVNGNVGGLYFLWLVNHKVNVQYSQ